MTILKDTADALEAAVPLLRAADARDLEQQERIRALEAQEIAYKKEIERLRQPARPASLLFWSSFGEGVTIGAPRDCYQSGCWQDILGLDSETGFLWPPKMAASAAFQMRSGAQGAPETIGDFIVNEIQSVPGRSGAPTRALHQLIKKNPVTGLGSQAATSVSEQCPYLIAPKTQDDLYISFWRKLPADFTKKLLNSWHMVFEWKTTGDYRVSAQLVTYGGAEPYWQIRADNIANGGLKPEEFWRVENRNIRVQDGEWFKFETFWHRSKGADGRVWMAVNGQKLVDKLGPNIGVNSNPIDRIFLMQLYTGASYPIEQWTDDVQIWGGFPDARAGDPWHDGVYGPH